ncbi:MAG: hypothetical protein ABI365_08075, partial [Lysobacteraceae bacterium]
MGDRAAAPGRQPRPDDVARIPMKKIRPVVLLFGFEPFGGEDINPAQEVVRELAGERIAGHRVVPAELPVT